MVLGWYGGSGGYVKFVTFRVVVTELTNKQNSLPLTPIAAEILVYVLKGFQNAHLMTFRSRILLLISDTEALSLSVPLSCPSTEAGRIAEVGKAQDFQTGVVCFMETSSNSLCA